MPILFSKLSSKLKTFLFLLTLLSLPACETFDFPGVYRIDVPQGNVFTQEMVDQLKIGMSLSQVRFVMGTPLITDSFNQQRWDYAYQIHKGVEVSDKHQLTLLFDDDKLVEMRGDFVIENSSSSISDSPSDNPAQQEETNNPEGSESSN